MNAVRMLPAVLVALALASVQAAAQSPQATAASLTAWQRSIEIDPRVQREIERFSSGGEKLGAVYGGELAAGVRQAMFAAADAELARLRRGECAPRVEVGFAPQLRRSPGVHSRAASHFEASLVRIVTVACLRAPEISAEEALRIYTDPDFRQLAEPRISDIRVMGDELCVDTRGVPAVLSPSSTCNRVRRFLTDSLAAELSDVVSNGSARSVQPIYFKSSLKAFTPIDGGIAFVYVNYSRAGDLSRLERWAGERQIRSSQESAIHALQARLSSAQR